VFNVWLIHVPRAELYARYGNTNLGFANDAGKEGYLLAGLETINDIVVYTEFYNRPHLFAHADI